jgi:uncharacterized protein (TIGR02118 family)
MAMFRRRSGESPITFAERLHALATSTADRAGVKAVVLFVDDGDTGAPMQAAIPSTFHGGLLVTGEPGLSVPAGDATYTVRRRVIKGRPREAQGSRAPGFTVLCPSVRLPSLERDEFDVHWRDIHSAVHVTHSPGTVHYEQLAIDARTPPDAPDWDGIALLSFASAEDFTERLFGSEEDQRASMEDAARFVDLAKSEALPASEFVYLDDLQRLL